jgi:hypothetical protein
MLPVLLAAAGASGAAEDTVDGRKFHPGHYVALDMWDDDPQSIRDVLRPGVRGVQKRYAWRDLEVRKDEYDLSAIAEDLAVVRETGHQLVVFVFDKSFRDEYYTPEYLRASHTLPIRSEVPGQGYVSMRWDSYVVDRLSRLVEEIGRRFDDDPRFEGVALQESALGVVDPIRDREGYTPERYRDALISILGRARAALPRSQVFWYMNYLWRGQGLLGSVIEATAPWDILVGGPDVLPESVPLNRHVYPLLKANRDRTLFTSAQFDSFRHARSTGDGSVRYWTPHEIFDFARDELQVEYLFWNRVIQARPAGSHDIEDAYPVIAAHPDIAQGRESVR